jgi:hypothetical protein
MESKLVCFFPVLAVELLGKRDNITVRRIEKGVCHNGAETEGRVIGTHHLPGGVTGKPFHYGIYEKDMGVFLGQANSLK